MSYSENGQMPQGKEIVLESRPFNPRFAAGFDSIQSSKSYLGCDSKQCASWSTSEPANQQTNNHAVQSFGYQILLSSSIILPRSWIAWSPLTSDSIASINQSRNMLGTWRVAMQGLSSQLWSALMSWNASLVLELWILCRLIYTQTGHPFNGPRTY